MNIMPWSTVTPGIPGNAVVSGIQYLLKANGAALLVDGHFGPVTAAAVSAFQSVRGLTVDGIVGPETWPTLVQHAGPGSPGDATRAVQQFGLLRYPTDTPLVVNGTYDPSTSDHVRFFQESWGLTQDGLAGLETWSFLGTELPTVVLAQRSWPLVKQGATQADNWRVRMAQYLLRAHGAGIVADGDFGAASGAAVSAFQQTLRSTEIGTTVGQLDWPALIVTVSPGDAGDAVAAAQTMFGGIAVDGVFGPQTEAAVRDFQSKFAPPEDGIVGPRTWYALTLRIFD